MGDFWSTRITRLKPNTVLVLTDLSDKMVDCLHERFREAPALCMKVDAEQIPFPDNPRGRLC